MCYHFCFAFKKALIAIFYLCTCVIAEKCALFAQQGALTLLLSQNRVTILFTQKPNRVLTDLIADLFFIIIILIENVHSLSTGGMERRRTTRKG